MIIEDLPEKNGRNSMERERHQCFIVSVGRGKHTGGSQWMPTEPNSLPVSSSKDGRLGLGVDVAAVPQKMKNLVERYRKVRVATSH